MLKSGVSASKTKPELLYTVKFADGMAQHLRRDDVKPDILQSFETARGSRRKLSQQRKPRFRGNAPEAKRRKGKAAKAAIGHVATGFEFPKLESDTAFPKAESGSSSSKDHARTAATEALAPPPPPTARPSFRITKKRQVQKYGPSPGCAGCLFRADHTSECRERIEGHVGSPNELSSHHIHGALPEAVRC